MLSGLPSFSRDWIELERAASIQGTEPGKTGNADAEGVISKTLSDKGWSISNISVNNDDANMTVEVHGKQARKSANDLKSDTLAAAREFIASNSLGIPDEAIVVKSEILP